MSYKTSLNKFEKTGTHKVCFLATTEKIDIWEFPQMLEANNTLLNNPQVKKEITKEILKYSEFNENENTTYWDLCTQHIEISTAHKALLRNSQH